MTKVLWTVTALLLLQAAHSYILLTANMEDVQNIARDLRESPVGGQVGSIMRRAYSIFNNQVGQARADDKEGGPSGFQLEDNYRRNNKAPYERHEARSEEKARSPPKRSETNENPVEIEISGKQNKKSDNTTRNEVEFSALGKSASVYLQKIQKLLEDTKDINEDKNT